MEKIVYENKENISLQVYSNAVLMKYGKISAKAKYYWEAERELLVVEFD